MRVRARFLVAGVSIVLSSPAWAQVPAGPVFRINDYTTGRQAYANIAMEADGDFVVVWDHSEQYPVVPWDVFARRFNAGGVPIGGDFRVNAFTTSHQTTQAASAVSLDARGNAVVAWSDFRNVVSEVFARRVSAAGVPLGTEFVAHAPAFPGPFLGGVAVAPGGGFVVVWDRFGSYDVQARRFDPAGNPLGAEFRVNTFTTGDQLRGDVAVDAAGNFTIVWDSFGQDGPQEAGVFGQRFDASGQRLGGEFQVNTYTTGRQNGATIAMRRDGSALVAWQGPGPGSPEDEVWVRRYSSSGSPLGAEVRASAVSAGQDAAGPDLAIDGEGNFVVSWGHYDVYLGQLQIKARRFAANGASRGGEFQVPAPTTILAATPSIASDAVGNFVLTWSNTGPHDREVFGQRFGGLFPAALSVADGDNAVLEVGDSFATGTVWRNLNGAAQTFQGRSSDVVLPPGLALSLFPDANYGTVASGAVQQCIGPCFAGTLSGSRPSGHVDARFLETILPDAQGQAQRWILHVGGSFTDVPRTSGFYRSVETLLHHGITGGCGGSAYCPAGFTTREQMSVFVLAAKEGSSYAPPACSTPVFGDVPASSPFCRWIEELARRGVTGGCGGGNYCPGDPVSREQMAVFVLRTLDPNLSPPPCGTPVFNDVPADSLFCRWIEELARRGVVAGCGGGNYCPTAAVTREQMAVFLTGTFGLTLYGP